MSIFCASVQVVLGALLAVVSAALVAVVAVFVYQGTR